MKYDVVHHGVVREVGEQMVVVGIEAAGACEGCKVQGLCGLSGEHEKEITVWDKNAAEYRPGDEVVVGVGTAMALKAVLWAYIVPFLLMLAVLVTLSQAGASELVQGVATLTAVAAYYLVLWFFRKKLERDIVFKIRKTE
jgi:sigma-E factor negative regulatory protein RseC